MSRDWTDTLINILLINKLTEKPSVKVNEDDRLTATEIYNDPELYAAWRATKDQRTTTLREEKKSIGNLRRSGLITSSQARQMRSKAISARHAPYKLREQVVESKAGELTQTSHSDEIVTDPHTSEAARD